MADNQDPSWRSYPGGPKKKAPPAAWKQADPAAPGAGRGLRLFGLSAAAIGTGAGIIYLIWFLLAPTRPGLVVVAPGPTNVALLNHPYDPLGYASGKALLAWAKAAAGAADANPLVVVPVGTGEPYWADDLDRWAGDAGAKTKIDPVIIYVAGHGGVDAAGDPVVYAGRPVAGRTQPAVRVKDMIAALRTHAGGKHKVLILDAGRGYPDPLLGEVGREFAAAVAAKTPGDIGDDPKLLVICDASPGEEAWEVPEHGTTALAYHLLRVLNGAAPEDANARPEKFNARELFALVAKEVELWSTNNRPGPQKPALLPAAAAAADPFAEKKVCPPKTPVPLPPRAAVPPPPADRWAKAEKLAATTPGPWVYTPAAWRRHRELSARLDRAEAAGDAAAVGTLTVAIGDVEKTIAAGRELKVESARYSLALPAATGTPDNLAAVAGAIDAATRADAGGTLAAAAADVVAKLNGAAPPVEAHFLLMLDHYQTTVLAGLPAPPPGDLWRPLVKVRVAADRAALGVPAAVGHAYSERVWPVVAGRVTAGDLARRAADDAALATRTGDRDPQQEAAGVHLPAAEQEYKAAAEAGTRLQEALGVRDRAAADAPFFARWLAEADAFPGFDPARLHADAVQLLHAAHALGDVLDGVAKGGPPPAELAGRAADVLKLHGKLVAAAGAHADAVENSKAQQSRWRAARALALLPAGPLAADRRAKAARAAAAVSAALLPAATKSDAAPPEDLAKVVRRADGLYAGFDAPAWRTRRTPGTPEADPKQLPVLTAAVRANPDDPAPRAALAAAVRANRDDLNAAGLKPLTASDRGDPVDEEAAGRLAVPYDGPRRPEQAVVNRAARWATLFEAMAERAALDHWYDAGGLAYFARTIAPAYLADADAVGGTAGPRPEPRSAAYRNAAALGKVDKLELRGDGDGGPVRWTSEADRLVTLSLAPKEYPVPGSPVVWWGAKPSDLLKVAAVRPQLADGRAAAGVIRIARGPGMESLANGRQGRGTKVTVDAGGFFRGQVLAAPTEYDVNPRPDLVFSEVRRTDGAKIALRGDVDPGYIGILIDYSGSMDSPVGGGDPQSRKAALLKTAQEVFPTVPPAARVSLRLMVGNKDLADTKAVPLFQSADGGSFAQRFESDILPRLRAEQPEGGTPLLPVMSQLLADAKGVTGPKTILVLTDGADTSLMKTYKTPDAMSGDEKATLVAAVRADYRKRFAGEDVTVHVVLFAAGREQELATDMFQDVVENAPNPGRVFVANSTAALAEELKKAFRPKPRLVTVGRQQTAPPPPPGTRPAVPPSGLPVAPPPAAAGEPLVWWWGEPSVAPDNYLLQFVGRARPVALGAGDRLLLRMQSGPGGVAYRREVYYDYVAPNRKAETAAWHVAVPGYDYYKPNGNAVRVTAAVEAKPAAAPAADDPVRVVRPGFVWWELARLAGPDRTDERTAGTVYAWNLENLPAPAWRILADDREVPRAEVENRLRGWVAAARPPAFRDQTLVVEAGRLSADGTPFTLDDGAVTVRVSHEKILFYPDPNDEVKRRRAAGPLTCVVVRVGDKKGRIFQARLPGYQKPDGTRVEMAEHRYYYRDDPAAAAQFRPPVAGYTGVFQPISLEEAVLAGRLEVELIDVSAVLADPAAAVRPIDLAAPPTSPTQHPPEVKSDPFYLPQK